MIHNNMEQSLKFSKVEEANKNIEKKDILNTQQLEKLITNASPTALEQCWNVIAAGETWLGITAMVMGGYMGHQLMDHEPMIRQNIVDNMQHVPSAEEIKSILMALKVFTASVGSIGIVSTIAGVVNRKKER